MKRYICILFLLSPLLTRSQEQLGLRLENFAGASSIFLNPAGNLTNPLPWDLNIAATGLFANNNYAYIAGTNSMDLIRNRDNLTFELAENNGENLPRDAYLIDYYDDNRKRFFTVNSFVAGPSLVLKVHENHSVGLFTNFRTAMSSLDFPNELSYYKYDSRPGFEPFSIGPFSGAFMSWSEIGLNYAFRVPTNSGFMGFGINVKRLTGYEAGFIENRQAWTHTKLPDDHVIVEDINGTYGLTTSNLDENGFDAVRNGSGFGADLGFLYVIQGYDDGYKWRLGASLLDIGSVKFDKNAELHNVSNSEPTQLNLRNFDDYDLPSEWNAFLQHFSEETLGDPQASLTANSFKIALPTAFNLQADYNFDDRFFLNGLFVHRLPTGAVSPARGSLLAMTPRYEHQWYSVSMPVSLLNWQKVHVGLAARLGYLVIGTDNLGSWMGRSDYTGSDIYVALKLNGIRFGQGLFNGGSGKNGFGNGKNVKCYDF